MLPMCVSGGFLVHFFSVFNLYLLVLFTEVMLIKRTSQVMGLSDGFADTDLKRN